MRLDRSGAWCEYVASTQGRGALVRGRVTDGTVEDAGDEGDRGRSAAKPWQVPWTGWKDVLWRVAGEIEEDGVVDAAASVAFFGLLALFPALIATVSLYGILADPADVVRQVNRLSMAVPGIARSILAAQLDEIQRSSNVGLRLGFFVSLAIATFSASGGVAAMMRGINQAYDEEETRGWLRFRALALVLTLGFAAFVVVSVGLITLLPTALRYLMVDPPVRELIQAARWPTLAAATIVGLGILYRYAPNRTPAKWQWVTPGALLATLIWTLASLSFSLYADNFGRFNKTYGTLGGAVVLGLWMYLSALAILLGAELNSELEHQTEKDSTIGPERPMGKRGARVADQLGPARPTSQRSGGVQRVLREKLAELNRPRRGKGSSM